MEDTPLPRMDDAQRIQLSKLVKDNGAVDQTALIRQLKHSAILLNEADKMVAILAKYELPLQPGPKLDEARLECAIASNWLFQFYTDIFNRILKCELDMAMFRKFVAILKQIEDGELDQHEASFQVGTILKEIYIDSALKKADKMAAAAEAAAAADPSGNEAAPKPPPRQPPKAMSWADYKRGKERQMLTRLFMGGGSGIQ